MTGWIVLATVAAVITVGAVFGWTPAVLLGIAMLLVFALGAGAMILAKKNLEIGLEGPSSIHKRSERKVTVTVNRKGRIPLGRIKIHLEAENRLTGERVSKTMDLNRETEFSLPSEYAGALDIRISRATVYDWFGVIPIPVKTEAKKRVLVMPDTFPVYVEPILGLSQDDDATEYSQERKGQDQSEIFQVREYVPGDSIRRIHWKLSEKMNRLFVRDASLPIDYSLMVFCDRLPKAKSPKEADALMESVTSVCRELADSGLSFHLVWNEENVIDREIAESGELPEAISALLKAKRPQEERSLYEWFVEKQGATKSTVLYFAETPGENLPASAAFRVFAICEAPINEKFVTAIHPDKPAESLNEVIWNLEG